MKTTERKLRRFGERMARKRNRPGQPAKTCVHTADPVKKLLDNTTLTLAVQYRADLSRSPTTRNGIELPPTGPWLELEVMAAHDTIN